MLVCSSCGFEAQAGKFCAKCGAQVNSIDSKSTQQPVQGVQVDQIKDISKGYIAYFKEVLLHPTRVNETVSSLVNPIISLVLFSLAFAMTLYVGVDGFVENSLDGFWGYLLEDIAIISFSGAVKIFFAIALLVLVPVVLVFLLQKFFVGEADFKKVFHETMNYMPILICVTAVAFVLQLINAYQVAFMLLALVTVIAVLFLHLFILSQDVANKQVKIDKFFVYIILVVCIVIIHYIAMDSLVSTMIEELKGNRVSKSIL